MKKIAMMITAATLACTVGATGVWAAGPGHHGLGRVGSAVQCLWQDADGDGVCDNRADGTCRYDTDGDGVCDYHTDGSCRYDTDGDGLCDAPAGTAGQGYGCHGGRGACRS